MIIIKKLFIYQFFFLSIFFIPSLLSFDWEYYLATYPELKEKKITTWLDAFKHFMSYGISHNLKAVPENIYPTNFDWQYYQDANNLTFSSEEEALTHYRNIGFYEKLPYCRSCTFVILLHLHNLDLMDELVQQINYFIKKNPTNTFHIKINIPVAQNILTTSYKFINRQKVHNPREILTKIKNKAPYHPHLITLDNCQTLYKIYKHIKSNLIIDKKNVQVLFSENRGCDIGGFLLLLDQLIQQNLPHDFIIKLHTKTSDVWRKILTSFMNIPINRLLNKKECLYSNKISFDFDKPERNRTNLRNLLKPLNLPEKKFEFSGGTMFIVSSKFTDFFKNHNCLNFVRSCNYGAPEKHDGLIEHAFERFFGYIIDHLNLKKQTIGYHAQQYSYDNTCVHDLHEVKQNTDIIKQIIDENKIKIMAIYFPQFHQFPENDALWGKGFTEWTLLNKYKDDVKKPHIDIGEYNMLDYNTRKKQAYVAKQYGISAFCYYHYWFSGKKVMYEGVEKILEDNEPNLPFTFCWANEPWINIWNGKNEILLDQKYGSIDDWIQHYNYLSQFFKHPNYIKEENCPVIYIYRLHHIKEQNALEMFKVWKKLAQQDGFSGLKVISILGGFNNIKNLNEYFDGFAEHQPTYGPNKTDILLFKKDQQNNLDIQKFYQNNMSTPKIGNNYTRGIFYSWDNSSRRFNQASHKFINLSYKAFENFLLKTIENIALNPNELQNFILLNSWNEWTEQAIVEPNDHDGYKILEILQKYFIPN